MVSCALAVTRHAIASFRKPSYALRSSAATPRVALLLGMLAARLKFQHETGSRYYLGNSMTAVDVYSATFMALFHPLPQEQCEMSASTRAAFETRDAQTEAALDPILLKHRDMMYAEYLELPLSL
jgi:glutathione S-transferase